MGKFFEAMQRAAEAARQPPTAPVEGPGEQPVLDAALLEPEEQGDGDAAPSPSAHRRADARGSESPSAVIRLLESAVHPSHSVADPRPGVALHAVEVEGLLEALPSSSSPAGGTVDAAGGSPRLPSGSTNPRAVLRDPDPTGVRVHPAYDRIVQRLLAYRRTPRQSVILITSAVPGEGTSTIARNVATALSHSRTEQVLLLDANLRTPSQHDAFGVERSNGLSDVLKGDVSLSSAVRNEVGSGISLLTAGRPVKSPTQLLTATGMQGVVMALLSLFDWIIIDSSPATAHPDAVSLAAASGGAMLVIQAESTRAEVVEEARNILQGTGVDLLGAVLNRRRYHIPDFIYRRL